MDNHSNSEQHRVETLVKVYLVWDDIERQWALDPAIDPKYGPLDGLDSGDWGSECDCPRTDTLPGPGYDEVPAEERTAREEHEKVLDRAVGQCLPDAEQLLRMLADYLGYGLFRCPQIHHGGPGCAPDAAEPGRSRHCLSTRIVRHLCMAYTRRPEMLNRTFVATSSSDSVSRPSSSVRPTRRRGWVRSWPTR